MEYYTLENYTFALDELKKQCSRDQMLTDLQDIKSSVATLQSITDSVLSVINVEESDPSLIVRSLAMLKNNASSIGGNLMTSERQRIESPFVDSYHNPSTYVNIGVTKNKGNLEHDESLIASECQRIENSLEDMCLNSTAHADIVLTKINGNRERGEPLIASERQRVNGDVDNTENGYQSSTTSTNKRGTKEINQLGDDELDQIQSEASTLLLQDAKTTNMIQIALLKTLYKYKRILLTSVNRKFKITKNKIANTEYPRAANNTVKGPYRRNHQYNPISINTINPHINNKDSVEGLVRQNCPIPTRITLRDQTSKRHRGLPRKRYSQYKHKKYNNVISQKNGPPDEVFRTGSCWETKMKFFQLYF